MLERMAKILRPYQAVSTTLLEILLQRVTACNSVSQAVTTDNALGLRAPVLITSDLKSEEREEKRGEEGITRASSSDDLFQHPLCEVFEGLDWYGAKLPPSVTVSQFLYQAEKECRKADVDLGQEMLRASGWLMVHPDKRKKRLGPFLMGWFQRAKNPPAWMRDAPPAPRVSTLSKTGSSSLDCNDPRWHEVPENLKWMHVPPMTPERRAELTAIDAADLKERQAKRAAERKQP